MAIGDIPDNRPQLKWEIAMTALQELDQFTRFAQTRLRHDEEELSLEECLRLWRRQSEEDETVVSIQQSLADYEAGRVKSVDDAFENARQQLGMLR